MLLTVIAEYQNSPIVKILSIDERTGDLELSMVDSSDTESLQELQEALDSGLDYVDFEIVKSRLGEDQDADELRHICTNIAPGEPDMELDGLVIKDSPSFLGFLRKLIREGGSIVLPLKNLPEQNIPHWGIADVNTIRFSDDMGISISSMVPGEKEDHWRWISSVVLQNDYKDQLGDVTGHVFLTMSDFEPEEYADYLVEHENKVVVKSDGTEEVYRAFSVTSSLPIYTTKSNILVTPAIISRLKFVADCYKLSLFTLKENLFAERKMEYGSGGRDAPMVTGRYLKLKNDVPITKKTADAMSDHMLSSLKEAKSQTEENDFLKIYPHYNVYFSIIKNQISTFFGPNTSKQQQMQSYKEVKTVETLFYLLLQECKYHVMFSNDAYLFNLWTGLHRFNKFNTDIPNYKLNISGGGGTWRSTLF